MMRSRAHNLYRIILSVCVLPILLSCGGEDQFKDLLFTIAPERPVVSTADATTYIDLDGIAGFDPEKDETVKLTAPWFLMIPEFVNNTDSNITIVTLKFTFSAQKDGKPFESEHVLQNDDPSNLVIAELAPGQSQKISGGDFTSTGYYLSSLPKADGNTYAITAELVGWVGTSSGIVEKRLTKRYTFSTQ